MIALLITAMIPIYGPLIPPIEGALWPVTTKVAFIDARPVDGGMAVRMSYTKLRDCEIIGVSMDRKTIPVEFDPIDGSTAKLTTRGTGPQISREWFVGSDSLDDLRLRFIHRCNPLWLTVTVAYP